MSSPRTSTASKVIVFGYRDLAQLARFYIEKHTEHRVVAFCVSRDHIDVPEFDGLPIIAFEDVATKLPPSDHKFFVPMTHRGMGRMRKDFFDDVKKMQYDCISYVSPLATVLTDDIGENCFILEDNTIQPFVSVGDNVVMWSGNHIGHHSVIRDNVFFTSHVVLSGHCDVGEFCYLGVNSTIRDNVTLAEGTLVAQSASVIGDTQPWSTYMGVPARLMSKSSVETMP